MWCQSSLFNGDWFWISFVQDDDDNCEFFVWVDETKELGYVKCNGIGVGHGKIDGEGSVYG